MADETPDSGNRVTLNLVYRTVDDLKALNEAQFGRLHDRMRGVERNLDILSGLPDRVARVEEQVAEIERRGSPHAERLARRMDTAERRIATIEESDAMQTTARQRRRAWLIDKFPFLLFGLIGACVGAISLYLYLNQPKVSEHTVTVPEQQQAPKNGKR